MKKRTLIPVAIVVASGAVAIGLLLSRTRTASPSFVPLLQGVTQQPAASGSFRLVCVDSDERQSTIWAAPPDAVNSSRQRLLTVDHPAGYPITAALSPASQLVAYSNMSTTEHPEFNGSLWIADVNLEKPSGQRRQIDQQIDHGWAPRWSPDGKVIAYLKTIRGTRDEEGYHDLYVADAAGNKRLLYSGKGALDVLPIGWTPDGGGIYIDRIEDEGEQLCRIDVRSGELSQIAQVSDGISWNLTVSPDGKYVVGSILSDREKGKYSLISISTETGAKEVLEKDAPSHYTAIWTPDSKTVTTSNPLPDAGAKRLLNLSIEEQSGKAPRVSKTDQLTIDWPTPDRAAPAGWAPNLNWAVVKIYRESGVELGIVRNSSSTLELIRTSGWLDYLGWINAGTPQTTPTLQPRGISFMSPSRSLAAVAVGERAVRSWKLPDPQIGSPGFKESDSINTIRIIFSRAVSQDGFGSGGKLQNVTIERLDAGGAPGPILGTASIENDHSAVRVTIIRPKIFVAGSYRLVIHGNGDAIVKAEDDSSPLDGDFDGKAGGDFVLTFSVAGLNVTGPQILTHRPPK